MLYLIETIAEDEYHSVTRTVLSCLSRKLPQLDRHFILVCRAFLNSKMVPNANYVFTYYTSEEVVREGVMNLADFNDGVGFRVLKNRKIASKLR